MTLTQTTNRLQLINDLTRAIVRHRMADHEAELPVEEIDRMINSQDIAFTLHLLRIAAPLYPLPAVPNAHSSSCKIKRKKKLK